MTPTQFASLLTEYGNACCIVQVDYSQESVDRVAAAKQAVLDAYMEKEKHDDR